MSAATATRAHKESKPDLGEITIVVHGGLIETVNFPPELEGRLTVRVEDEDVDGVEAEDITTDTDGREYCVTHF